MVTVCVGATKKQIKLLFSYRNISKNIVKMERLIQCLFVSGVGFT
jgi:hypothetical protein